MVGRKMRKIWCAVLAVMLAVMPSVPAWADSRSSISEPYIKYFGENDIIFYTPMEVAKNFCTSGGDCYISGETRDEKLWSALRHVGFTPEQTAGIMGNIVHEGGSPTRQENAYIIARNQGCRTQEGYEYTIYLDSTDGAHHAACMQQIYSGYAAGNGVAGVGLGFVQWTSHDRRLGYLEKMAELGLLKYFEGDAYNTYGRYTDDQLKEAIEGETGSDSDYWALWCAAMKFIWTEMNGKYSAFFNNSTVEEYAGFTAQRYEVCAGCQAGQDSYNARVASAEDFYRQYQTGVFDAVENGTAPTGSSSSSSNTTAGANVTIIGDSITNGSRGTILLEEYLPDADVYAQNSKHFVNDVDGNPSGLSIVKELKESGNLRDIVVFALGTNDSVSSANIKEVVDEIGAGRKIFFLTNYDIVNTTRYDRNNQEFAAAASLYDNVSVIDWKAALTSAGGALTNYIRDETEAAGYAVHPTEEGQKLFAQTIKNGISGVKASESCTLATDGELVFYYQSDEPWGSMAYGDCGDGSTIGSAGCGPTSLAMVITALTGQKVTPDEVAKKAAAAGYRACGKGSSHAITNVARDYGLTVEDYGRPSIEEISNYLRQGVMFQVAGSGPSPLSDIGHFIAVRGITADGKWLIFDSSHKNSGNNEKEWDPSEIYPYINSDWRGVSK